MVRIVTLLILSAVLFVCPIQAQPAQSQFDNIGPRVMGSNKLIVLPGDVVTFTVALSGEATGNEVYHVDATASGFSVVPATIMPTQGATSVTFDAVVGPTPPLSLTVSVSDAETSASLQMLACLSSLPGL